MYIFVFVSLQKKISLNWYLQINLFPVFLEQIDFEEFEQNKNHSMLKIIHNSVKKIQILLQKII